MATIVTNQDGTLTATLTSDEQETLGLLEDGELAAYLTQWLADKRLRVIGSRFSLLSGQDKSDVMQKFRAVPKPK